MSESKDLPPFLLGAASLFWGLHNQFLVVAAIMAILLEGARRVPWRWDFGDKEFNRVADLSGVLFLGVVVYLFDKHSVYGIYVILQWLPFILLPLVITQTYSTRDTIKLSALFWTVRKAESRGQIEDGGQIDIAYPYFAVCLLSASAGISQTQWFFPGVFLLVAWMLWFARAKRYPLATWVVVLTVGGIAGYVGQEGVIKLRRIVEPWVMDWIQEHASFRDPFRAYTAIGHIGKLKASDRIILRVQPADTLSRPVLLREASYQTLSNNMWFAVNATFSPLDPALNGSTWNMHGGVNGTSGEVQAFEREAATGNEKADHTDAVSSRRVGIAAYLRRGKGLLALPNGTYVLEDLKVGELEKNALGAAKVLGGPDLVRFSARYAPDRSFDASPTEADLRVPRQYQDVVGQVAAELRLAELSPVDVLAAIARYFNQGFEYSLVGRRGRVPNTALGQFLVETKAGHCEYFATASVLLLRAGGIPARYATGYSVQEYSDLEKSYIVRKRHAHAWALAFVDGRWSDLDTTPAVWGALEAAGASWWAPAYDLWAWVTYQYSKWRWSPSDEGSLDFLLWLVVPLTALLLWRLSSRQRVATARGTASDAEGSVQGPGTDSEFYMIESALSAQGFSRHKAESLMQWIERLNETAEISGTAELIESILPVHYRYRFDPRGLNAGERSALREAVNIWLELHTQKLRS